MLFRILNPEVNNFRIFKSEKALSEKALSEKALSEKASYWSSSPARYLDRRKFLEYLI